MSTNKSISYLLYNKGIIVNLYKGKLHFIILNYTPDYTSYPKLFECPPCILNYNPYYTLHPNVSSTVKLDKN